MFTESAPPATLTAAALARLYPMPVRAEDAFLPHPGVRRESEAYDADPDEGPDPDRRHN